MKKLLGIIAMAMVIILPMSVSAANVKDKPILNCTDGTGTKTCTISIDFSTSHNEVVITLTPMGGAEIQADSIKTVGESDWSLQKTESNGVYTITLTSPGSSGEQDLITYTYKTASSSDEQCAVVVGYEGKTYQPDVPTKEPDKPTDNKQTGTTLPYIALGVIALGAAGAYVATRNKSKMYKI